MGASLNVLIGHLHVFFMVYLFKTTIDFLLVIYLLLLSCRSSLYILNKISVSYMKCNIFSQLVAFLYILFICLWTRRSFTLILLLRKRNDWWFFVRIQDRQDHFHFSPASSFLTQFLSLLSHGLFLINSTNCCLLVPIVRPTGAYWWKLWAAKVNEVSGSHSKNRKKA